jgi:hypothetical protein
LYDRSCQYMQRSNVGDNSCQGYEACYDADDIQVGNNSCQGDSACYHAYKTQVGDRSCQGKEACQQLGSTVGNDSCQGDWACHQSMASNIKQDSCQGNGACYQLWDSTVGNDSCLGYKSCYQYGSYDNENGYGNRLTIGSNACNRDYTCMECENDSVVPDNACNGDKNDLTEVDKRPICNYCRVSSKYTTSIFDCVSLFSSQLYSPLTFYS